MLGISKRYGATSVLKDVTLKVRPGEIHALLGENGAGKSTLMNVLFGMPVIHETGGFQGEVRLSGQPQAIVSPHDAMDKGIGMVHQEFMLIPGFTITENIKLNREIAHPNLVSRVFGHSMEGLDMRAMAKDARTALDKVGMSVEEYTLVEGLPVGYMQFVEIAREIDKTGVKLLVFDEPTAVLTESEADQLVGVMRKIAESGIAIIFITHRLDEVMAASDQITILRDGQLVATRATKDTTLIELAELMIGRGGQGQIDCQCRPIEPGTPVALKLRGLKVAMPGEEVENVDLDVYEGEILGIGGLAGQGKVGIPNGVMGLYPASGEAELFGEPLPLNNAKNALEKRLSMVSEDRRGVGLLLEESIEDNIVFNAMQVGGAFEKPLMPDPGPLSTSWWKLLIAALLAVACLAFGIYGNSQWPDASAPAGVIEVEDPAEELPDADLSEAEMAGEAVEAALDDEALTIDETVPTVARVSPLFLILGTISALVALYILLYPLIHRVTDRIRVKDAKAIRAYASKSIKDLDIRCRGPLQHTGTLSGGNQQKVCVARALAIGPKFLFVSEPTRGIDIGAKKLVLETLVKLNRELGMTIVMVSSELLELRSICDRIAIVSDGEVVDIFPADVPDATIGLAMSGIRQADGDIQRGGLTQ